MHTYNSEAMRWKKQSGMQDCVCVRFVVLRLDLCSKLNRDCSNQRTFGHLEGGAKGKVGLILNPSIAVEITLLLKKSLKLEYSKRSSEVSELLFTLSHTF